MKILTVRLFAAALVFAPIASFACGDAQKGLTKDQEKIASQFKGKDLVCVSDEGDIVRGQAGVYAIYRCMNSPTYMGVRAETDAGKEVFISSESISLEGDILTLKTDKGEATCTLDEETK